MAVTEISVWKGEKFRMTYYPAPATPPSFCRAGGFFFNEKGEIIIAKTRGGYWTFPGGHPEGEETMEQTLHREFFEEAGVELSGIHYLGYVTVEPISPKGEPYHQTWFAGRISKVGKFVPNEETFIRKFVGLKFLPKYIPWATKPIGKTLIEKSQLALSSQHKT